MTKAKLAKLVNEWIGNNFPESNVTVTKETIIALRPTSSQLEGGAAMYLVEGHVDHEKHRTIPSFTAHVFEGLRELGDSIDICQPKRFGDYEIWSA